MKTQIKVYAPKPILIVREIAKIAKIESSDIGEYNFYLTMQKQLSDSELQRINNECGDAFSKIEFLTKHFWYSKSQHRSLCESESYCIIDDNVIEFSEASDLRKTVSVWNDIIYLGYGKECNKPKELQ